MVGINDLLLGGKSARDIWEGGLKAMYDEALEGGARVIGMLPLPNALVSRCGRRMSLFWGGGGWRRASARAENRWQVQRSRENQH